MRLTEGNVTRQKTFPLDTTCFGHHTLGLAGARLGLLVYFGGGGADLGHCRARGSRLKSRCDFRIPAGTKSKRHYAHGGKRMSGKHVFLHTERLFFFTSIKVPYLSSPRLSHVANLHWHGRSSGSARVCWGWWSTPMLVWLRRDETSVQRSTPSVWTVKTGAPTAAPFQLTCKWTRVWRVGCDHGQREINHFPPAWTAPPADATLCLASGSKASENLDTSALELGKKDKKQSNNTLSWWQNTAMPVQCTMFVTPWERKRETRHSIVYNGEGKGHGAVICAAKGLSGIVCCCSRSLSWWFIDRRHRGRADGLSSRGPMWQLEKSPFLGALFLFFSVCLQGDNWKILSAKASLELV